MWAQLPRPLTHYHDTADRLDTKFFVLESTVLAMPGMSDLADPQALPRPDAAIALWLCHLEADAGEVAALARSLSPSEHARAARFGTDALRQRWIVGRATLRALLGR